VEALPAHLFLMHSLGVKCFGCRKKHGCYTKETELCSEDKTSNYYLNQAGIFMECALVMLQSKWEIFHWSLKKKRVMQFIISYTMYVCMLSRVGFPMHRDLYVVYCTSPIEFQISRHTLSARWYCLPHLPENSGTY
jgi:hypothetical protein